MPVYTARLDATSVSSAATLVQLNAPSNAALKILRAWASVCTVTSCALQVRLTAGDVIIRDTFNVLNGYLYLPVPEERIVVPPGCALSLDLPVAPFNASSLNAGITWSERE